MEFVVVCLIKTFILFHLSLSSSAGELAAETRERAKRTDDVSMSELHALVLQQASAIQTLQAKVTALETRDSQLPSFRQVAFSVRFKGDNIALGSHSVLRFDNVITNVGNGYDPQTGIFTAPVPGVYVFFLSMMSVNGHGHLHLAIDKHGTALGYAFADGSDVYDQGAELVTAHLAAGEQVWVRQHGGDAVRGDRYTSFSGYLEQADVQ